MSTEILSSWKHRHQQKLFIVPDCGVAVLYGFVVFQLTKKYDSGQIQKVAYSYLINPLSEWWLFWIALDDFLEIYKITAGSEMAYLIDTVVSGLAPYKYM